jgi:hypothetical protein
MILAEDVGSPKIRFMVPMLVMFVVVMNIVMGVSICRCHVVNKSF